MKNVNLILSSDLQYQKNAEKILFEKGYKKVGHILKDAEALCICVNQKQYFEIEKSTNRNHVEIWGIDKLSNFI